MFRFPEAPFSEEEKIIIQQSSVLEILVSPLSTIAEVRLWGIKLKDTITEAERPLRAKLGDAPYEILMGGLLTQVQTLGFLEDDLDLSGKLGFLKPLFLTGYQIANEQRLNKIGPRISLRVLNLGAVKPQYEQQLIEGGFVTDYLASLGYMGQVYGNMHKYEAMKLGQSPKTIEDLLKDLDLGSF